MRPDRALEQLVTPVYRFALRLTRGDTHAAEDITQEAVVKALQSKACQRLPDGDATRVWLFTVLANVWRDRLRRRRVRRSVGLDAAPEVFRTGDPAAGLETHERTNDALRLIDELPDRQREVLYLSVCADLSVGQIAAVLGIRPGAVKASLSLARQRVAARIENPGSPTCLT